MKNRPREHLRIKIPKPEGLLCFWDIHEKCRQEWVRDRKYVEGMKVKYSRNTACKMCLLAKIASELTLLAVRG